MVLKKYVTDKYFINGFLIVTGKLKILFDFSFRENFTLSVTLPKVSEGRNWKRSCKNH